MLMIFFHLCNVTRREKKCQQILIKLMVSHKVWNKPPEFNDWMPYSKIIFLTLLCLWFSLKSFEVCGNIWKYSKPNSRIIFLQKQCRNSNPKCLLKFMAKNLTWCVCFRYRNSHLNYNKIMTDFHFMLPLHNTSARSLCLNKITVCK